MLVVLPTGTCGCAIQALRHLQPPVQLSDTQLQRGAEEPPPTRLNQEVPAPHSTSPTVPPAALAGLRLLPRHNAVRSGEPHHGPCMKAGDFWLALNVTFSTPRLGSATLEANVSERPAFFRGKEKREKKQSSLPR